MPQKRIIIEGGSTTAWVVWGQNHLLQRRQFAFDGRIWFYQHKHGTKATPFEVVNSREVPANVVSLMAAESGLSEEQLRQ